MAQLLTLLFYVNILELTNFIRPYFTIQLKFKKNKLYNIIFDWIDKTPYAIFRSDLHMFGRQIDASVETFFNELQKDEKVTEFQINEK